MVNATNPSSSSLDGFVAAVVAKLGYPSSQDPHPNPLPWGEGTAGGQR
jgi:hypothetical protein